MQIRSITGSNDVDSFRLRQTIATRYRDMPAANSVSELLTEARRDPPAVMTAHTVDGGAAQITLILPAGLWTGNADALTVTETGPLPIDWADNAYRELGDMSLVAPLTAQTAIDAGDPGGAEVLNGIETIIVNVNTDAMIRLLMADYKASGRAAHDPDPPDSYLLQYVASFWIDPATGFVLQEQTIVEYTEERLHGQATGTGPATFTTTRTFSDFNAEFRFPAPDA